MATVESEPLIQPAQRWFTVADLEALPTELPSGPIDYELDNGRLVFIMVPPGDTHGAAQLKIGGRLLVDGEFKGFGKARTEVGVVLWRNPDRVLTPDVLFVANKSLPLKHSREGYLETIPELVVEVRSKNDSLSYIQHKVDDYLRSGVEVVWVADPATKTVTVHSLDRKPTEFGEKEKLELPRLIPDFSLPVSDVFRE
ncbi:MAG: Uma2 family endonuclease [Pirellulales bacterium]